MTAEGLLWGTVEVATVAPPDHHVESIRVGIGVADIQEGWLALAQIGEVGVDDGAADGFLLVTTPVNWQIDYVVVRPDRRGLGIAAALVAEALNQAHRLGAPYVMLTSKASLRPLYESCGFTVVGTTNTRTPPRFGEGGGPLGTLLPLPSQGRGMGG